MYATVVHQLGAVQCMELDRAVQVNRLRVLRGEPAWLVVGLHQGMEEGVADAREVKRVMKRMPNEECRIKNAHAYGSAASADTVRRVVGTPNRKGMSE